MNQQLCALQRRLQALEDTNAIKELQAAYWRGIDLQRPEEVYEVFAPDVIRIDFEGMPGVMTSREEFVQVFRELGCQPHRREMHHGQNPKITFAGLNTARGVWHLFMFGLNLDTRTTIQLSGEYNCEYVRKNGRWWIKAMVFRRNSILTQDIAADGAVSVTGLGMPGENAARHLSGAG